MSYMIEQTELTSVFQHRPDMPRHNGDVDVVHTRRVDSPMTLCGSWIDAMANFATARHSLECCACRHGRDMLTFGRGTGAR